MASPETPLFFSFVPQNQAAEIVIGKLGHKPFVSELPSPQGKDGMSRVACVKFNPTRASGLEPSFPGYRDWTDRADKPFQFILNMNTGEILLEDFSDGQAFRFMGPTALTFPNPPHPRKLIVDRNNNLEFECLEPSGSWSKWAIFWYQTPPVNPLLRSGVMLTDGAEVCQGYKRVPDSGDDLIRYVDRG